MATAHQIRDLITETTTGTVRPRVPREVREEVCRYADRRREQVQERGPLASGAREFAQSAGRAGRGSAPLSAVSDSEVP